MATTFAVYDNQIFTGVLRVLEEKPVLAGKPYRKFYELIIVDPPFNPTSQIRTGPVVTEDHVAETRTHTWTVRDKTAQELDAEKDARVANEDFLQFEIHFDLENRVRALEGKSAITRAQYRAALKARL